MDLHCQGNNTNNWARDQKRNMLECRCVILRTPMLFTFHYYLVAQSETLCLFPIYRARAVYEHQTFFQCTHRTES